MKLVWVLTFISLFGIVFYFHIEDYAAAREYATRASILYAIIAAAEFIREGKAR